MDKTSLTLESSNPVAWDQIQDIKERCADIKPLVVIQCITYNHGPYIKDALEGFVMQKTDFPFVALVHDDASTDNTAKVIQEYANKYPDIILPIYEQENQWSKHDGSVGITMRAATQATVAKYIALCEGDDYWIDPFKLQKQVDIMEKDPGCTLVVSNGIIKDNITREKWLINPIADIYESGYVSPNSIIMERALIPTASMLYRSKHLLMPQLFRDAPVGDKPRRLYLITCGGSYYFDEPMVIYRNRSVNSFSQRILKDKAFAYRIYSNMLIFYDRYKDFSNHLFDKEIDYKIEREKFLYYVRSNQKLKAIMSKGYKARHSTKFRIYVSVKLFFSKLGLVKSPEIY